MTQINTLPHLAYILKCEPIELEAIPANIDGYYYEKRLSKGSKNGIERYRLLHPSTGRLKMLQSRILKNVLNDIELPSYAHGAVKGKDNIKNAKTHQGKKYNFTTDLRNFFPSVSHHQVFQMFRSNGFSPTVARVLTQLTTYKGRIPQGAPTSAAIANLVFVKTGKRLREFARTYGITFTSFVDDLTFSGPADFKDKVGDIIQMILEDGFKISHSKTFYKTKNPIVTGIVVKNNLIDLQDNYRIKIQVTDGKSDAQIRGELNYKKRVLESNGK